MIITMMVTTAMMSIPITNITMTSTMITMITNDGDENNDDDDDVVL